jgi:hypothetical protein
MESQPVESYRIPGCFGIDNEEKWSFAIHYSPSRLQTHAQAFWVIFIPSTLPMPLCFTDSLASFFSVWQNDLLDMLRPFWTGCLPFICMENSLLNSLNRG